MPEFVELAAYEALKKVNAELHEALDRAYDAIAHAENYHQPEHVWKHLREAKQVIATVLGIDGSSPNEGGDPVGP